MVNVSKIEGCIRTAFDLSDSIDRLKSGQGIYSINYEVEKFKNKCNVDDFHINTLNRVIEDGIEAFNEKDYEFARQVFNNARMFVFSDALLSIEKMIKE